MENEVSRFSVKSFFTVWRLAAFMILLAVSIRFSMAEMYKEMSVAVLAALFGPAQWVYLRDKQKGAENEQFDEARANRWFILVLCLAGAGLAYFYSSYLISSLTILAGMSQFWFRGDITSGERMWHGFTATILAGVGYIMYRPLMYICLPLSVIFAISYTHLQKKEKQQAKAANQDKNKRSRKSKKKRRKK